MGGMAGMGGVGGMGGMGGTCPDGVASPESVNLKVTTTGLVASYEVPSSGLQVTPGTGSGLLFGDALVGMGTDAIGNRRSIESGLLINESIVFGIFRTDGTTLGAAENAVSIFLSVVGAPENTFDLTAQDKDGGDLGTVSSTVGMGVIDVASLIPGPIHSLTIEATGPTITLIGIDYIHACLGYDPAP
jgi:hypothetical protein